MLKNVTHEVNLTQFSGPLDLLLSLVEEQKMDITEISLSAVTEQYLKYLKEMSEADVDELADFLVIAARLLLLKSRSILPQLQPIDDNAANLADQLRVYKAFVEAARGINRLWLRPERSYFRIESPRRPKEFSSPANFLSGNLRAFMVQLLHRLEPPRPLPSKSIDRRVTLKEKIAELRAMLNKKNKYSFREILSEAANRTEVIIGFLALLELVKQADITLHQEDNYSDIFIKRHSIK